VCTLLQEQARARLEQVLALQTELSGLARLADNGVSLPGRDLLDDGPSSLLSPASSGPVSGGPNRVTIQRRASMAPMLTPADVARMDVFLKSKAAVLGALDEAHGRMGRFFNGARGPMAALEADMAARRDRLTSRTAGGASAQVRAGGGLPGGFPCFITV
jgi:hypothetical protein